ncbi:MAG: biopolymer transporter ExbD [Candidatus Eisenbacteria bacterium]|uniref:Biopolymer transporter ExbD n=1 Tax=Eiseniibacteriota bacterium TaxID=2212470 RepID=A0A538TDB9_UNCEI|nr:MAG: biopolymer transporter ExbD [Candidatus Eisenbacteria bacterium]
MPVQSAGGQGAGGQGGGGGLCGSVNPPRCRRPSTSRRSSTWCWCRKGPDVHLPNTTKPTEQGDERGKILVTIDQAGGLWIDDQPVPIERFGEALRAAVGTEQDPKVVIKGDARLTFREVRQAMLAVAQAGFQGVGLIAKRAGAEAKGD